MMATEGVADGAGKGRREDAQLYVPPSKQGQAAGTSTSTPGSRKGRRSGGGGIVGGGGARQRHRKGGRNRDGKADKWAPSSASVPAANPPPPSPSPAPATATAAVTGTGEPAPGESGSEPPSPAFRAQYQSPGDRKGSAHHKQRKPGRGASNRRGGKQRNTESFVPDHSTPDMRLIVGRNRKTYGRPYSVHDVVVVPELFAPVDDRVTYDALLAELQASGCDSLFVSWHGDSHLIADDKKMGGRWKKNSPTFQRVVDQMRTYFGMDIKATRFNWYQDDTEWKPYHHDRAAFTPDCPQNMTVAASFGAEREVSFLHAKKGSTLSIPQPNGCMYAFGRDVNIDWKHGVLQVPPEKQKLDEGRISIIAWGWVDMTED